MPKDKSAEILSLFKTDPRQVQKNWGFIGAKKAVVEYGVTKGCRVNAKFIEIQTGLLEVNLNSSKSGQHYYYPFVPKGVGSVDVPLLVDNGTMVFTPGMSGCALYVFKKEWEVNVLPRCRRAEL